MNQSQIDTLLDGPALAPPPGIIPNLTNPPKHTVVSYLVTSIAITVATLAVVLRMYTSIHLTKEIKLADYSLLVGWGLFVGFIAVVYEVAKYGPGIHQWDLRLRDLGSFLYWYHIGSVLYGLIICFVKLSILSQYIQIFMPTKRPPALYWTTIFLMTANIISYIIFTFLEIFACNPIDKAWDPLVTNGHCLDILVLNTAATGINTGSDFIILLLPQLVIWRLRMSWKNKANVSVVFMIAILAIMSSAVRLNYCVQLQHSDDLTYYSWIAGIWALPEIMFGIVVACLPALPPLLRALAKSKLYIAISSCLQRFKARAKRRHGQGESSYVLHDQIGVWPPGSGSGKTWVSSEAPGGTTDSGSAVGLRVNTRIETLVEEGRYGA